MFTINPLVGAGLVLWASMHELSLQTRVERADGYLEAEIDNEIVLLNVRSGLCYGLNRVGSRIWQLLAAPVRITDLCAQLIDEYEVEQGDCENQVLELLTQLRAQNLIFTNDQS